MITVEEQTREEFITKLIDSNFTTYYAATHPKHSKSNPAYRFTKSPVSIAIPHQWSYRDARERLMELSTLLTPQEAERMNINLVNPALKDFMPAAAMPTLRAGIQMVPPGAKAAAHRHSANAFRIVLENPEKGAYTAVQGKRLRMKRGDLVLTPNWAWHEHHNEGDKPVIWYDGLDVMMPYWIGGVFFEEMHSVTGHEFQELDGDQDDMAAAVGTGGMIQHSAVGDAQQTKNSPLMHYPYENARSALQRLEDQGAGNPFEGVRLEYINPINCGPVFPSMSVSIQMISAKSTVEAMHRTENILYLTLEGSVTFNLPNNQSFTTEENDVVAIPSWVPYSITNNEQAPAVLASQSDRPVFKALGWYREQAA
ncbi:cupin domain-containing protein [Pusillimonas sp.]|uniref:cupin domain-containing protein n=1 Tax=Pusillimonas sp. TaxID=3040095 RepID=UPI0037C8D4E3